MMRYFTDMTGNTLALKETPKRIVSVVPSQTELLFDLGLNAEVVGITKFCVHPEQWFRTKTRVGGTKQLHIDQILALAPDLIIANKEENTRDQIEALAAEVPVWVSDIRTVEDALSMIRNVGILTDRSMQAEVLASDISLSLNTFTQSATPKRVAYFIWYQPWMSVGNDTFIHDMVQKMGWINVFEDLKRYPEVTIEMLKDRQPEIILLSSEPFPFKEQHVYELKQVVPDAKVLLVDGEMFSWYGSRMLKAIPYFTELLRHEAFI